MWVSCHPCHLCCEKENSSIIHYWGLDEMKPGSVMDIMLPHDPSPLDDGGDKKLKWSGVWNSVAKVQFSPVLPPFFENRELN